MAVTYDCLKCPGYCCSYPIIALQKPDIERLARHFSIPYDTARERFTKEAHGRKYVLRRKQDEHFGRICRFFDTDKRRCTVYEARPEICRAFPKKNHCGYYDFLTFERDQQGDETWVARTDSGEWK